MTVRKAQTLNTQEAEIAMLKKAVATRLAGLREARKLTQNHIAEKGKISPQTVKRLEAGRSFPQIDTLALYLVGLDMTIGEFFAPWIRPGTIDYDRECHVLLIKVLSDPGRAKGLKPLLSALAADVTFES